MFGDIASDMVVNGALERAQVAEARLQRANQTADHNGRVADELADGNAANLALRYALATALEKVDPTHPLLKDVALVERIKAAAVSAYSVSNKDFDAAREVGRSFVIPERDKPRVRLGAPTLMASDTSADSNYAGLLSQREALIRQLRKADPTNPLLTDPTFMERLRVSGRMAFTVTSGNMEAAREVGQTFQIPGRE